VYFDNNIVRWSTVTTHYPKHRISKLSIYKERATRKVSSVQLLFSCDCVKLENNLEREKRLRADVEKNRRKLESDLRSTQDAVEELEKIKRELEETVRKWATLLLCFDSDRFRRDLATDFYELKSCNNYKQHNKRIVYLSSCVHK